MKDPDLLSVITVILSIGAVVGPVLFGWTIYKMTSVFVTKEQFNDYKLLVEAERHALNERLARMEASLDKSLARLDRILERAKSND